MKMTEIHNKIETQEKDMAEEKHRSWEEQLRRHKPFTKHEML
jgi:hypothetical protein